MRAARDALTTLQQTMADARIPNPPPHERHIAGPLEGYRLGAADIPIRVFDLTRHGCVIEISAGSLSGKDVRLQIDLPGEGWTVIRCVTIHIAGHNTFAVKFIRLDDETRHRIDRAIDRQPDRSAEDNRAVVNQEANDD